MGNPVTTTGFTRAALDDLIRHDGGQPIALERRRGEAFRLFEALPMPSPETEEWRYTDLRDLDLDLEPFVPRDPLAVFDAADERVRTVAATAGDRAGLIVQQDSSVVWTALGDEARARGVRFDGLDATGRAFPDEVARYLHHAVPADRSRFVALHAAFRAGGTFVHVPPNVRVQAPLESITFVERDGMAVFPHTVIVLDQGSELTFIDRYVSPDLGRAFCDAVVELYLGPGSKLRYASLQDWGRGMTHLSVQRAVLERDAELRSLGVAFGASVARSEVESILQGDGSSSEMLGLYFAREDQHVDHRSIQDHVGSQTSSDLLYKGALKGTSRTIYSGNVIIRQGAHRCDAYQTNRNVLLSESAKADSIPNLEILSNDPVRCGHAASIGPVDEHALFYLESRGIPAEEAERLIVTGFFQEVIDRVAVPELTTGLERAIAAELES